MAQCRSLTGCGHLIEEVARDDKDNLIREQARAELAKAEARLSEFKAQIIDLYYFRIALRSRSTTLMRRARGLDAHRKFIQRTRRTAVKRMERFLLESGLDYEAALAALASRN